MASLTFMSYAEILFATVPAAPPTRKNQRTTSCPAPISAKVPYHRESRLILSALEWVSSGSSFTGVRMVRVLNSLRGRNARVNSVTSGISQVSAVGARGYRMGPRHSEAVTTTHGTVAAALHRRATLRNSTGELRV